jgi:hypothetical protein
MSTQLILTVALIALATAYIARSFWMALRSAKGCSTGCGKCPAAPADTVPGRVSLL